MFAHKCSVAGQFFQVYAKPSSHLQGRLGITVNKRYVPLAVSRNFCKRLAREIFRANRAALGGVDLIVRARAVVLTASSVQARKEMLDLMQRARRLCCDGSDAALKR